MRTLTIHKGIFMNLKDKSLYGDRSLGDDPEPEAKEDLQQDFVDYMDELMEADIPIDFDFSVFK